MWASVSHFLPVTTIRRTRLMPLPGKVLIRRGQKVSPVDVIAEAKLSPEHLLLDVGRGLGLSPNKADQYIQVKAGEEVEAGDVLAGPVGIARRVVRAPKTGRVILAGSGQVLLELETRPFELRAGIPGTVVELIGDRGAEIEATGSVVTGVWGNGRIEYGLLNVLARAPGDVLTPERLDVSLRGSIVLAGIVNQPEVFGSAGEIPLRGMILASMDSALVPAARKARFPILLVEGFGSIPMNSAAFKLLSTSDRREIAINAEPRDPHTGARPEIIIPLPSSGGETARAKEMGIFTPGQRVRMISLLGGSVIGNISEIPPGLAVLPSGIQAQAAKVRLESGELVLAPLANLEILE